MDMNAVRISLLGSIGADGGSIAAARPSVIRARR